MTKSLNDVLIHHQVEASAPCRIDSGGTCDIKAMALPMEMLGPTTVNIALNLRTTVRLSPFKEGWVKITSQGFPRGESFPRDQLPLDSPFGLFFAAISYFDFHGLEIHISSQSPVKSALGGSSTALAALIKSFSKVSVMLGGKGMSGKDILHLAYHLEDGVNMGNCGMQDHAAAVYGGVNQWKWRYGHKASPLERISLLDGNGQKRLSRHILVAYSGKTHISLRTNRIWIKDYLSGKTRSGWIKINEIVHNFARALRKQEWKQAADILQQEMALRRDLTPEVLIPITSKLIDRAEEVRCGARFAGAGAGGAIWALGEEGDIRRLRKLWENTLVTVKDAKILDCEVDAMGAG